MKYKNIKQGFFISRPNRFIAKINLEGKEEVVHVKNTGRCRELLVKNAKVILEESNNTNRKTKYSLIAVYKGDMLVNMDSQIPNAVAYEALLEGKINDFGNISFLKREVTYSKSRFDLYFESDLGKGFIEVKGVTLEQDGVAAFPDAPTERGTKHVSELIKAQEEGYTAGILLLVQMKGPRVFVPNSKTDPEFSEMLRLAAIKGVKVICYDCMVLEDEMIIGEKVKVDLVGEL